MSSKDSYSKAPLALVQSRLEYLSPSSTKAAAARHTALKNIYIQNIENTIQQQQQNVQKVVKRFRLTSSVRNVRIQNNNGGVSGSCCLSFSSCATTHVGEKDLLVLGSVDGVLSVWDLQTPSSAPVCIESSVRERHSTGRVRSIVAHPSLPLWYSTTMNDRSITAWQLTSEEQNTPYHLVRHAEAVPTESEANENSNNHHYHTACIQQLAMHPAGHVLASVSKDNTLKLYDVEQHQQVILSHSASNHNQTSGLQHLYTQDGFHIKDCNSGLRSVSFHPDGALLIVGDDAGRVSAFDVRNGRFVFSTNHPNRNGGYGHLGSVRAVQWSPCGVRFASGGADHIINLWDARMLYRSHNNTTNTNGGSAAPTPIVQFLGHDDHLTSLQFYACQGSLVADALVSTALDHTVRLWDMNTGLCVRTLQSDAPVYDQTQLCTSPEQNSKGIVTVGHAKYWSLWEAATDDNEDVFSFLPQVVENEETITLQQNSHQPPAVSAIDNEESEEEDEMEALLKKKTEEKKKEESTTIEKEESSSEDEMMALRR
ncbi:WD domain, G-beta repeat, putative [Angomonas deanei]|uniref:WD domain, G-beta repeat, putative n=1 Tax=Angomonas deanei TaxID=59799 RepID=A0A7G2CNJ3_9TRYP|nr:WD domain, G-beta repeat, putative [Angomonas deanei]